MVKVLKISLVAALIVALSSGAWAADTEATLKAGETATINLLILMDSDKSGKVSKKEFEEFMKAEFERLDINKDGELDVSELIHLHEHVNSAGPHR